MSYLRLSLLITGMFCLLSCTKQEPTASNIDPLLSLEAVYLREIGGINLINYCALITLKENMGSCKEKMSSLQSIPGALENTMMDQIKHYIQADKLTSVEAVKKHAHERKIGAGI